MKYKVGDKVEIVRDVVNHGFDIGHRGIITIVDTRVDCGDLKYRVDNEWWVTEDEIKPITPIDLNTKTPIIVTEDIKVWVWDDDVEQAEQQYLYSVDKRINKWSVRAWDDGKTAHDHNFNVNYIMPYKHASFTDPREPKNKTITIDGKDIEISAESYQNLKDHFNGLED